MGKGFCPHIVLITSVFCCIAEGEDGYHISLLYSAQWGFSKKIEEKVFINREGVPVDLRLVTELL
jgi:hypothetical protein